MFMEHDILRALRTSHLNKLVKYSCLILNWENVYKKMLTSALWKNLQHECMIRKPQVKSFLLNFTLIYTYQQQHFFKQKCVYIIGYFSEIE